MEQPDPSPADSLSVLGVGHLLDEILLHLDVPAFLVLASQACRFWRSRATHPAFLRRFRDRLALRPRPLGFHVSFIGPYPHDHTKFVPMSQHKFVPMSQRPELAAVVARASFGRFDHHPEPAQESHALDCRNGRVLLNLRRYRDGPYAVLSPLDKAPAMAVLPP